MKKYPRESKLQCPTCLGDGYVLLKNYHALRYFGKYTDLRNKIRKLGKRKVAELSLRELGREIGYPNMHPSTAKHHLSRIEKMGWRMEK